MPGQIVTNVNESGTRCGQAGLVCELRLESEACTFHVLRQRKSGRLGLSFRGRASAD